MLFPIFATPFKKDAHTFCTRSCSGGSDGAGGTHGPLYPLRAGRADNTLRTRGAHRTGRTGRAHRAGGTACGVRRTGRRAWARRTGAGRLAAADRHALTRGTVFCRNIVKAAGIPIHAHGQNLLWIWAGNLLPTSYAPDDFRVPQNGNVFSAPSDLRDRKRKSVFPSYSSGNTLLDSNKISYCLGTSTRHPNGSSVRPHCRPVRESYRR